MHVRNNGDVTVASTTTETSILGASQANSTKTVEAGLARAGRIFLVRLVGAVSTAGTPTLRIRLKLGSTTIADTTAIAMANNTGSGFGGFVIEAIVHVITTGASGSVSVPSIRASYNVSNGGAVNQIVGAAAGTIVDLAVAQTFDVTVQWSAASASNAVAINTSVIEMSR
jgi:hypothetical protein